MLVFDRENPVAVAWCEYAPGVRVKINPINRDDFRRLREEATRSKGFRQQQVDSAQLDAGLYQHIVAGWEGIVDPDGEPIPCTAENIPVVMSAFIALADWVADQALALAETQAEKKGRKLKNSNGSPDGTSPGPAE